MQQDSQKKAGAFSTAGEAPFFGPPCIADFRLVVPDDTDGLIGRLTLLCFYYGNFCDVAAVFNCWNFWAAADDGGVLGRD